MLVEIPDPEIILGVVAAFFVGLFSLYIIYKIKPTVNRQDRHDSSSYDRLEFYERQLINKSGILNQDQNELVLNNNKHLI